MARPGLGRLFAPDPRDAGYPLRALVPPAVPQVTSRFYKTGPVLNQGSTSECVAYAWKQFLDSAPIMDPEAQPPPAQVIYDAAQIVDEWAGTPHKGTSVRAGAKVLTALHRLGAYHWSTSAEDVRAYLLTTGTVVLGTDWMEDMFRPGKDGFVKVSGPVAGGHAYLAVGWSQKHGAVRCINSWGSGWGQHGRFWMAGEDLQKLLERDGEACAGVEVR